MIIAAAIRRNGKVYALPAPARHHEVIAHMIHKANEPAPVTPATDEQGFIDHEQGFVDRRQAARIAELGGQIKRLTWPPELYSEDLW